MAKKEDGSPLRVRFMKRLRRILWGEVCISCGDRGAGDELLCAACAAKFQRKLAEKCPDCGSPRFECYCAPPRLRDAGCEFLAKLASYDASEADCPLNRVIWRQKHVRDRECAAFLAGLLAVPAGELLDGQGVDRSHLIVTYVPRDPGKILARRARPGASACRGACRKARRTVRSPDIAQERFLRAEKSERRRARRQRKKAVFAFKGGSSRVP